MTCKALKNPLALLRQGTEQQQTYPVIRGQDKKDLQRTQLFQLTVQEVYMYLLEHLHSCELGHNTSKSKHLPSVPHQCPVADKLTQFTASCLSDLCDL